MKAFGTKRPEEPEMHMQSVGFNNSAHIESYFDGSVG